MPDSTAEPYGDADISDTAWANALGLSENHRVAVLKRLEWLRGLKGQTPPQTPQAHGQAKMHPMAPQAHPYDPRRP